MKILITGAAGFAGRHLVHELKSAGHDVWTSDMVNDVNLPNYVKCDISNKAAVDNLFNLVKPDAVAHLAGIASIPQAEKDPVMLERINVGGTINCLTSMRKSSPGGRFLFVSTAQVYGSSATMESDIVDEYTPHGQLSLYAFSKIEAEKKVLASADIFDVFVARPTNHIGPGQSNRAFVPSIVEQAKAIKRGVRSCYMVGNIASGRDFTDVRDVVSAYRMILENGKSSEIYNVSAGRIVLLSDLISIIKTLTRVDAPIEIDDALFRPTDFSRRINTANIRSLGWTPKYSLMETLMELCEV